MWATCSSVKVVRAQLGLNVRGVYLATLYYAHVEGAIGKHLNPTGLHDAIFL
jgi:hypothetical protein